MTLFQADILYDSSSSSFHPQLFQHTTAAHTSNTTLTAIYPASSSLSKPKHHQSTVHSRENRDEAINNDSIAATFSSATITSTINNQKSVIQPVNKSKMEPISSQPLSPLLFRYNSSSYSSSNQTLFHRKCIPNRLQCSRIKTTILYKEWPKSHPRLVSIRGERHSGTKLARTLIQRNSIGLIDKISGKSFVDQIYGWKHGYFVSDGHVPHTDIILILVRDVFAWALAMFQEPYNIIFEEDTTNFGSFLRGYYQTQHCEIVLTHIPKECTFPMEQANNIIQV